MVGCAVGGALVAEEFFFGEPASVEGFEVALVADSEPACAGATVNILIGAADGEVGVGPGLVKNAEAVVAVEDYAALVLVGFGDDAVEVGEELPGGEVDDA